MVPGHALPVRCDLRFHLRRRTSCERMGGTLSYPLVPRFIGMSIGHPLSFYVRVARDGLAKWRCISGVQGRAG